MQIQKYQKGELHFWFQNYTNCWNAAHTARIRVWAPGLLLEPQECVLNAGDTSGNLSRDANIKLLFEQKSAKNIKSGDRNRKCWYLAKGSGESLERKNQWNSISNNQNLASVSLPFQIHREDRITLFNQDPTAMHCDGYFTCMPGWSQPLMQIFVFVAQYYLSTTSLVWLKLCGSGTDRSGIQFVAGIACI